MTKLEKLEKELYPEHKEKYDLEKVQEEMWKLIQEQGVDKLVTKTFDTEKEQWDNEHA